MVDERLPSASVAVRGGAAGPLGRRLVGGGVRGGRGRWEELVGEDGGGPLATDYRRHGAAALPRRRRLVAPPQPISAAAVALSTPRRRGTSGRRLSPFPSPTRSKAIRPPRPGRRRAPVLSRAEPPLIGPGPDGLMGWVVGFLTPSSSRGVFIAVAAHFPLLPPLVLTLDFYVFPLASRCV